MGWIVYQALADIGRSPGSPGAGSTQDTAEIRLAVPLPGDDTAAGPLLTALAAYLRIPDRPARVEHGPHRGNLLALVFPVARSPDGWLKR